MLRNKKKEHVNIIDPANKADPKVLSWAIKISYKEQQTTYPVTQRHKKSHAKELTSYMQRKI